MLQNQLKFAFRNLNKNKRFSFINIFGLSLGMACCFIIIIYCWHEFNYDNFHKDAEQIYRVEYGVGRGPDLKIGRVPPAMPPALKDYFPEMEAVSRFYPRALSIELPESQKQFEIENVFFVDSSAVDVFEFDFIFGNSKRALHQPESVVITDVLAKQIFGKTDVIGKPLRLAGENGYRIAAVVKAWGDNSHLAFNMLLPFETMYKVEPPHARKTLQRFAENNWTATHSYCYVKLKPNQNPESVNARFDDFIKSRAEEGMQSRQSFSLLPIQDVYLRSDRGGPKPKGNLSYLYLFLFIGVLTLFIACINFINLSTANSMTRAKEVVMRKVLGAPRSVLIGQFLGESMLFSFLSFLVSLIITILALPYLNNLMGIDIPYAALFNPMMLGLFFGIFLLTGFLAGLYPAFFVSRFNPNIVLKGMGKNSPKSLNDWLIKGLITVQFLAAIGFTAGAITLYLQTQHLSNQPLGFNKDLVLSLPLNSANNLNAVLRPGDAALRQRMNTFDKSLFSNPNIKAVTQCSRLPGLGSIARGISAKGQPNDNLISKILSVDYDFAESFDLELVTGRDFDASFGTDHTSAFLINEKAINLLDLKDAETALGQELNVESKEGKVVGVLKDFHFENLRSEISPLIMTVNPGSFGYFAVRVENSNLQETLGFIEEKWNAAFPEKVFEYTFLDETLDATYKSESRITTIIGYAAFLAIFISCFGLFGLAALMTQQRFKEIGIRKVLGASVRQILQLIAKDFIKLIAVAMLIATPLTWYLVKDWLAEFAYRIDFPWWVTVASGVGVMMVAFFTITAQSIKAALSNPVDAIRNE